MTTIEFMTPPGAGEILRDQFGFSQIARIDNRIEIAGQGGWRADYTYPDTLEAEYLQAFDNVEGLLAAVGAEWSHVVNIQSYHLPTDANGGITLGVGMASGLMRERMPHCPVWTCIGVPALGDPAMRVEVRVTAILGELAA